MKERVVLYNPKAEYYTMPLALLALGSALDPARYEVVVVDGRLEKDPLGRVLSLLDRAICLGVTVLTGFPIQDALRVSRAARSARPSLPVVWGGWHPSLFGTKCLEQEGSIGITVQGQGEETFQDICRRPRGLEGVAGCSFRRDKEIIHNPPRPLRDVNSFPRHRYELLDPEHYFRFKGWRQLDYISSIGCRFRCAFCADPTIYERKWFGLDPERIGEEVEFLWKKYRFEDLNFQDETFFTKSTRVTAIAEEFLRRGVKISWAGTLRADQGVRLSEDDFRKCRESGLRRVMIGVESGSVEMLKWMKKDIQLTEVFKTAEMCLRHGVAAIFPFIVGFPDEPEESVNETLRVAYQLRSMSPNFEIQIFFYSPYPGSPITTHAEKAGFPIPDTLEQWARFDFSKWGPWVDSKKRRRVEVFQFCQRLAGRQSSLWTRSIQALARWQCQRLIG